MATSAPQRPAYTRKPSSAEFQGALKNLQLGPPSPQPSFETITGPDGKTVKITNSTISQSIPATNSVSLQADSRLGLIATVFYHPKSDDAQDKHYGKYVSETAIYEFLQTVERLVVPYKEWTAQHRALSSSSEPKVVEIALTHPEHLSLNDLRRHEDIFAFEQKWNIEVVLQPNNVFRRNRRLAVFDMDSTLIQQEVIDEIAKYIGVSDEVSAITARAMNGELDFEASLRARVALLKGVPAGVFEDLKPKLTFTPGARTLCKALKRLGYKMAVLSGGFQPLAEYIKAELGLDYAFANTLVVSEDGKELTGELTGQIIHAEQKAVLLQKIAEENGISLNQVVAVGDGANDLKMMAKAGLGVAFHAKPLVQELAPCRVNTESLQDVLYILGFSQTEQEDLLRD